MRPSLQRLRGPDPARIGTTAPASEMTAKFLSPRPVLRAFVPDAPATGVATLPGGGYRPLAHAEHVAVGVLEPRTASRTDLGDEVDGLRRLVFLERDTPRGQVADDGLQVVDLEMRDRLTDVRLSTPDRQL